ncbi:unnamed protein product, partial [Amoebophrya sp. A25]
IIKTIDEAGEPSSNKTRSIILQQIAPPEIPKGATSFQLSLVSEEGEFSMTVEGVPEVESGELCHHSNALVSPQPGETQEVRRSDLFRRQAAQAT